MKYEEMIKKFKKIAKRDKTKECKECGSEIEKELYGQEKKEGIEPLCTKCLYNKSSEILRRLVKDMDTYTKTRYLDKEDLLFGDIELK